MSFTLITPPRPLTWHPILHELRAALSHESGIFVVGGAVRDAALRHPLHDIDLTTAGDGCAIARRIANEFRGNYYALDRERGVGRALFEWENERITVDVARFRGNDLLADLQDRDFTINALAVPLDSDLQVLIDPTHGLDDLQAHLIRQCRPSAISDDPVRILRAVRGSVSLGFRIEPATRQSIKANVHQLRSVSVERVRDELFNLLGCSKPATALSVLKHLGILDVLIPETASLSETQQGPPHQFDVWRHSQATVEWLDAIVCAFLPGRGDDSAANLQVGTVALALAPLRSNLLEHIEQEWPNGRSHRALLSLAALLHDMGKPLTRTTDEASRVHFFGHESAGADIAAERADALRLSNSEIERLSLVIRHHMRPHWLAANPPLTPRAIYRFWRDTGAAGVDICLLAMADYLATYDVTLDAGQWTHYVETIQTLLTRYFVFHSTAVEPPPLVNGTQLLEKFNLTPGPFIGEIIEQLREAQVSQTVTTQQEALDFVQRLLERPSGE